MLTFAPMGVGRFVKYEGLGNDFVVVDATDEAAVSAEEAERICDRRFGVGADGVLLVLPPREPRHAARMRVLNADGSIPEMCGNGLRCVAVHVARARKTPRADLTIETDAGLRTCAVDGESVLVDMGVVRVLGQRSLDVDEPLTMTLADAGNPHAILFGRYTRADVDRIGPRVATDPSFPRGTNVEFARVDGSDQIDLVVWERGVGVTMACGTGACATAAAACEAGLASRGAPIRVRLPGGALEITIDEAGRAWMRGPARKVFEGEVA